MALRIACTGLVAASAGSVSSAGSLLLDELLRRGHEIDFYSKSSYVYPTELFGQAKFRYLDHAQLGVDRYARGATNPYVREAATRCAHAVFARRIVTHIRELNASRHYHVMLSMGQWALGRVPGLPSVGWVQGAPGTDSRSLSRHRRQILELCGAQEYARLRAYSMYRASAGRPAFRHTDFTICGSSWSAGVLASTYGRPEDTIKALPYPIDLEAFCPDPERIGAARELVWLGRVVPRKRLDLFLDAGAALISRGRDIRLTVAGGFPFAKGFKRLLDRFPYPDRLTYMAQVPRDEVRSLLQAAMLLVQPS
jgi:glycosyltransferase involved in cell wall biosynthesis